MKKIFLISSLILLLLIVNVSASDIGLVVKDSNNLNIEHEQGIYDILIDQDHNVVLIDKYSSIDYYEVDLLVIAGRPGNLYSWERLDSFVADIPIHEIPTLIIGGVSYIEEWELSEEAWTIFSSDKQIIHILDDLHEITDSFSGDVIVHIEKSKTLVGLGNRGNNLETLAIINNFNEPKIISYAEEGTVLDDGDITEGRLVFFGITYPYYWNNNAEELFKNSIQWILEGEDDDGDGILNKNDNCPNDYNPGQEDTDNDGEGDVCDAFPLDPDNDADEDGIGGNEDNCPIDYNPIQEDFDNDNIGDVCDSDKDGDGVADVDDLCPLTQLGKSVDSDGCAAYQLIVINEVEFNPVDETQEWIEIYNPNGEAVDLSGWKIKDSRGRVDTISSGSIISRGFFVFDESISTLDFKNNDNIQLLDSDDNIIDETGFLEDAENDDFTWQRVPDGEDNWEFLRGTPGLPYDADMVKPEVTLISPDDGDDFVDDDVEFEFSVIDDIADDLNCQVYLNDVARGSEIVENGSIGSVLVLNLDDGDYEWYIKCFDGTSYGDSEIREFSLNAPDAPVLDVIGSKSVYENKTLEFEVSASDADGNDINLSAENLPDGASFVDNGEGKGQFSWTPNYSQSGNYNVKFIAEDNSSRTDSETVKITVNNVKLPPEFSNIGRCEFIDEKIKIDIKDPDKGDEFEIREIIEGKVEIENNFDEKKKFDVEIYLYDVTEEEEVEDWEDDIRIKEDEEEKIEFEFEVDEDLDESNYYYIFVKAQDEDDSDICNEAFVEIDIEREDDDVVIDEFIITPEIIGIGGWVDVEVGVKNIGAEEQDAYIEIESEELQIYAVSSEFELEEYGEDDERTERFDIKVPLDAEEGEYTIKATVVFDSKEESEERILAVLRRTTERQVTRGDKITIGDREFDGLKLLEPRDGEEPLLIRKRRLLGEPKDKITEKPKEPSILSKIVEWINSKFSACRGSIVSDDCLLLIDLFLAIGIIIEAILIYLVRRNLY